MFPELHPLIWVALAVVTVIAALAVNAVRQERAVHAPDQPGMTAALLIRKDDRIRTDEGDLIVDDAFLNGDGRVTVIASDPDTGARYEYPWAYNQRVNVLTRVASPLVER